MARGRGAQNGGGGLSQTGGRGRGKGKRAGGRHGQVVCVHEFENYGNEQCANIPICIFRVIHTHD